MKTEWIKGWLGRMVSALISSLLINVGLYSNSFAQVAPPGIPAGAQQVQVGAVGCGVEQMLLQSCRIQVETMELALESRAAVCPPKVTLTKPRPIKIPGNVSCDEAKTFLKACNENLDEWQESFQEAEKKCPLNFDQVVDTTLGDQLQSTAVCTATIAALTAIVWYALVGVGVISCTTVPALSLEKTAIGVLLAKIKNKLIVGKIVALLTFLVNFIKKSGGPSLTLSDIKDMTLQYLVGNLLANMFPSCKDVYDAFTKHLRDLEASNDRLLKQCTTHDPIDSIGTAAGKNCWESALKTAPPIIGIRLARCMKCCTDGFSDEPNPLVEKFHTEACWLICESAEAQYTASQLPLGVGMKPHEY